MSLCLLFCVTLPWRNGTSGTSIKIFYDFPLGVLSHHLPPVRPPHSLHISHGRHKKRDLCLCGIVIRGDCGRRSCREVLMSATTPPPSHTHTTTLDSRAIVCVRPSCIAAPQDASVCRAIIYRFRVCVAERGAKVSFT